MTKLTNCQITRFTTRILRRRLSSLSMSAKRSAMPPPAALSPRSLRTRDRIRSENSGNARSGRNGPFASFVAYVFSHNAGLSLFGGSAVRFRILSGFGVEPAQIARVIAFDWLTFWLGFLALGGAVLALEPIALPGALAGLVGWSRLRDNRHWTSDVIADAVVGTWTTRKFRSFSMDLAPGYAAATYRF